MKKLFLLTLFSSAVFILQAQVNQQPFINKYAPYVFKMPEANTLRDKVKRDILLKNTVPLNAPEYSAFSGNIDNMPIVANELLTLNYLGNNNAGLDFYQSTLDNMFVVKPDSTFYSGMPTGSLNFFTPPVKVKP
ncbi:MAG TPA: hypothetical protein PLP23_06465 [Panacibacter sp.]|nr:hypothetical protein [Panacibacter sp.]